MQLRKILSENFNIPPSFSYFLSIGKNNPGSFTVALGSGSGEIHVFQLNQSPSMSIEQQISIDDLDSVSGLSLSGDGSKLYCTGGLGNRTSVLFDLSELTKPSPLWDSEMSRSFGICAFNPVMDLVARAYWSDTEQMEIQLLSFDKASGRYVLESDAPKLVSEYMVNSLTWSNDGKRLIITAGEVDDGYRGTNGTVNILELEESGAERKWNNLYYDYLNYVIGESSFNYHNSVAVFRFHDSIRLIDVEQGTVIDTKQDTWADAMTLNHYDGFDYIIYAIFSTILFFDTKSLVGGLCDQFDDPIVKMKAIQQCDSGFHDDLLLVLFRTGKLSIFAID